MKFRLISAFLAVLLVLACGCAKSGSGAADGTESAKKSETLWDKSVSVETRSLPEAAFQKGAKQCRAMAPDGVTFLMGGCANPYLYNIETKRSAYLLPADEETEETLRLGCTMPLAQGREILAAGKRISSQEELADISGKTLVEAYLFAQDMGSFVSLKGTNTPQFVTDGNYMVLRDNNGLSWLVDCDEGTFRLSGNMVADNGTFAALIGDRLYVYRRGFGEVLVRDVKTGKEKTEDFSKAGKFRDSTGTVIGTACLSDGSICVVLRSTDLDIENGSDCAVVVRSPSGSDSVYPLGKVAFNFTPDTILDAGGCLVALAISNPNGQIYKIDRSSGAICLLFASEEDRVREVPLEECSFTGGRADRPEGIDSLYCLETLSDGETILCQNTTGQLFLYRPSQSASQYLLPKDAASPLLLLPYYSSNHYDTFFAPGVTDFSSYLKLKVKN
ncbi:MAG: hypothetical protein J5938_05125 [Clostridia bacterium]|nr:hypothetical protein [Clostridia bacterium]